MKSFRTRIAHDLIIEFLPPQGKNSQTAIIVCDGLPSVPSKRRVLEYWSKRGFWVFHPRYRGAWESGGKFLDHDPTEDIIDVVRAVRTDTLVSAYDGMSFTPHAQKVVVIGASFGGTVALLSSLHTEVDRVVALSPVIDWKTELRNTVEPLSWLCTYLKNGFGEAYRFSDSDFNRLGVDDQFFNPIAHIAEYNPEKICIMHAKDDMIVSYDAVEKFLAAVPCTRRISRTGGHFSARATTTFFTGRALRRFILGV